MSQAALVADLDSPDERRWLGFTGAALGEGIRGIFSFPIMLTSGCVGALELFVTNPGPLSDQQHVGGQIAAELASLPLLDVFGVPGGLDQATATSDREDAWSRLTGMDRSQVHQAAGMLINELDVDADEALLRLRAHAIATSQGASTVARAILERRLMLTRDPRHGGGSSQP